MLRRSIKFGKLTVLVSSLLMSGLVLESAQACTRTLFVSTDGNTVITGRNLDWHEDMKTDLWVLPAGMNRNGSAGANSLTWTSRYGSIIASGYNLGAVDGMNEKGLVANLLYLTESDYASQDLKKPVISVVTWGQYVLDNFATVAEAVAALQQEPFRVFAPTLPNGVAASVHLSISDTSGDSAIFEYISGKLVIHHGKQYTVMTNSPTYDKQLALNAYWQEIGGLAFLPGTDRAADRFARAAFFLGTVPKQLDKRFISVVPDQSFVYQAVAAVTSIQRAVSVPLGITTPAQPNISSTLWRTISDQSNLNYYYDSATSPNTFWVSLKKFDLKPGTPVKKLDLTHGRILAGEASGLFVETKLSMY